MKWIVLSSAWIAIGVANVSCERADEPSRPLAIEVETDELADFLTSVRDTVESHRWDRFLALCNEYVRDTQLKKFNIPEPQFISEMLQFGLMGTPIGPATGQERPTREALETIEKMTYEGHSKENGVSVSGRIDLENGEVLRFRFDESRDTETGEYSITGGVG